MLSNLKFNVPILFPWLILSTLYDLITLSPWPGPVQVLSGIGGQILFFACFLTLLMIFLPKIIQYWWGCKPIQVSEKAREIRAFLEEQGFKYRDLMRWPIFEGRIMTAGLMGIVPRYRYILITDSLLEALSLDELKAVVSHEMAHAKYYHLLFYLLFFLGFMVLAGGLYHFFLYVIYAHPFFLQMVSGDDPSRVPSLFYMSLALPMLIALFVYFRYIMGYFMRNFERQADLYSAVAMGTPEPTIRSLEKIAYLSGKTRTLPSWHHFSIKERVDCLWRSMDEPGIVKQHNRKVAISFAIYLALLIGLGYLLNFSPVKQQMTYSLIEKAITQALTERPRDVLLYQNLAMVYHQMKRYEEAIVTYEKVLEMMPDQAESLNNLAWLLVTTTQDDLRNEHRGLELAKRAVAIERSPVYLDTLAEAYYVNGMVPEAVETIKEAISKANENRAYYKRQLKKFMKSAK